MICMHIRERKGRVNAIQTLGTLDGPGVRFVLFLQGCPLRCACCHNPETWNTESGTEYTAGEIFDRICRYKNYFGADGGVTISGGEALLQSDFVAAIFELCKAEHIHTCLDTSGCILNDKVRHLLSLTDLVLLDMKYTVEEQYQHYVGCSMETVLDFLDYLDEKQIETWLRQVLISTKNDSRENLKQLAAIKKAHTCVRKCELLAFRKLCTSKYEKLNLNFPFADIPETSPEMLNRCQADLDDLCKNK